MANKTNSKKSKKVVDKGITDLGAPNIGGISSALSVQALRGLDHTLSPQSAYQLSIDAHMAIRARCDPLSHGKIRLFYRKSGDEITSGDTLSILNNPTPGISLSAFLFELAAWEDLAGEMIVASINDNKQLPAGIYTLNPFRLAVRSPMPAAHLNSVKEWQYAYENGIQITYPASSVVLMKNFNPNSSVRGLPPLLAGVNEVSSSYEAMAYNRRFFSNNAEPSMIVSLPNVTDPKDLEAFKAEYIANYSLRSGNAHKVMVVGGAEVNITPVSATIKEGTFINLQQLTSERIMRLYQIPPIISGTASPGYSLDEQNTVFAEQVLLPKAERLSQFIQLIIDRWLAAGINTTGQAKKLSKTMSIALDKAIANRVDSDIVAILDIDHLPIISRLKQSKMEYAKQLQTTFKITPFEAAQEIGFDIEENDQNTKVWVPSIETGMPIKEQSNAAPVEQPVIDLQSQEDEVDDVQPTDEQKKVVRSIVLNYRKLVLEHVAKSAQPKLAECDKLNVIDNAELHLQFRHDYVALKSILQSNSSADETIKNVKQLLNKTYTKAFTKSIL